MGYRLWELTESSFQAERLTHYETLFTIGNGYLGTRGSFEEGFPGDTPTTLVHGIYDHTPGALVPELVNAPEWLGIAIIIEGTPLQMITSADDFMRPSKGLLLGYQRTLDMRRGLLRREILFRAASGVVVQVVFERFASLHDVHVLAQRVQITAVDGSPTIDIESALDASVTNNGARHWHPEMTLSTEKGILGLEVRAQQSGYVLGMASRLVGPQTGDLKARGMRVSTAVRGLKLGQEQSVTFDKITSIYTSRDVEKPLNSARAKVQEAASAGYDALLSAHADEWATYWETSDLQIEGDDDCQRAVRFATYHMLIPAPRHDDQVSIGAKTLSGLGYKGHIFWDTELFIVPPLILTQPQLARNLLMYRYHHLAGARNKARANGFEGAMFPWESTDTGEETTPQWSDPQPDGTKIRIWTGDSEQHISTDIALAVWRYWKWTDDLEFLSQYGAEIILDTAVFWGSRAESKNGRYEILQQIGPDEYHENIDNSVFTNRMVVWHLQAALKTLDWLRQHSPDDAGRLTRSLDLTPARLDHWRDIIARMYIPFDDKQKIHIQFPGFFDMEYIPVPHYQPRTTSVQAILGHPRTIQSQVIKQADVVMLISLLGDELGPREVLMNDWNTYSPRTDHGSSLSPSVHARVAAWLGLTDEAYDLFYHAAHIDLHDNKGNVRDGIHAAACGGLWQALVFGFCGLKIEENGELTVHPRLPEHWRQVSFTVYYRGEKRPFSVANPVSVAPQA